MNLISVNFEIALILLLFINDAKVNEKAKTITSLYPKKREENHFHSDKYLFIYRHRQLSCHNSISVKSFKYF